MDTCKGVAFTVARAKRFETSAPLVIIVYSDIEPFRLLFPESLTYMTLGLVECKQCIYLKRAAFNSDFVESNKLTSIMDKIFQLGRISLCQARSIRRGFQYATHLELAYPG